MRCCLSCVENSMEALIKRKGGDVGVHAGLLNFPPTLTMEKYNQHSGQRINDVWKQEIVTRRPEEKNMFIKEETDKEGTFWNCKSRNLSTGCVRVAMFVESTGGSYF